MRSMFHVSELRPTALRPLNYLAQARVRESSSINTLPLGELTSTIGAGYKHIFTNVDVAPGHGVEVLSQSDMFAAEPEGRHIRRDCLSKPERHLIRRWQILVAGAGTLGENELYGRPIIADGRLTGKYVAYHALDIQFDEPGSDLNLYVYAYLLTRHGTQAMRATSYGTKILSLRRDLAANLLVPLPDAAVQRRVADLVRQCVEQREVYLHELKAARQVIEELLEMREAHEMCAARRRHAIWWGGELTTMSAWTTSSTGGTLGLLQEKWSRRLGDAIMPRGIYNGPRFARISCSPSHGVEFMSQRDVFLMRPVPRQIAHPGFRDELLFAKEGTLLVGGHGTLGEGEIFGRAISVHGRFTKCAFTQDLLRLVPKPGMSNEVYAFLTTRVGMRLLRSTAVGTKILTMRPDLLAQIPLPELNRQQQSAVDQHMNVSNAARQSAEDAETEAVRILEEEVLPAWLS
jgi:hypothetical protein